MGHQTPTAATTETETMNIEQFNLLADRLYRSPQTKEAVRLMQFDGLTAYAAEVTVWGKTGGGAQKALDKLHAEWDYVLLFSELER